MSCVRRCRRGHMDLNMRWRSLSADAGGRTVWQLHQERRDWPAERTALLLCDVWDDHWCRGAVERLDAMLPRMEQTVQAARAQGVHIIHAPSDTMSFYEGSDARQRMLGVAPVAPPAQAERPDPPLPIDASDEGSDTPGDQPHRAWARQHPAIGIDERRDAISDSGKEVYSYLQHEAIEHLLIMGVHTNMCVLHRSFAIKQMVLWGVDVALVRDLTDTMYNPARPPYVSHEEGTRLVVEFIEKFWCPSMDSSDLLG